MHSRFAGTGVLVSRLTEIRGQRRLSRGKGASGIFEEESAWRRLPRLLATLLAIWRGLRSECVARVARGACRGALRVGHGGVSCIAGRVPDRREEVATRKRAAEDAGGSGISRRSQPPAFFCVPPASLRTPSLRPETVRSTYCLSDMPASESKKLEADAPHNTASIRSSRKPSRSRAETISLA